MATVPVQSKPRSKAAGRRPLRYVYLCSPPHSGSTLIACLLAVHPEVSTVGEFGSTFRTHEPCSCGVPYDDCSFWKDWITRAVERGVEFKLGDPRINLEPNNDVDFYEPNRINRLSNRLTHLLDDVYFHEFPGRGVNRLRDAAFRLLPARNRRTAAAVETSRRMAELLCEMEGTSVFLDTTKNPFQPRFLARSPHLDLKVIDLVRDGRGVMNSLMTHYSLSPEKAISCWLWATRNTARITRHYLRPEQVFRLRIEDLWAEPQATVQALCRFIGLDETVPLNFADRTGQHLIGNKMRLTFNGEIRVDEKWKRMLSSEHLQLFDRLAGERNRAFGYAEHD